VSKRLERQIVLVVFIVGVLHLLAFASRVRDLQVDTVVIDDGRYRLVIGEDDLGWQRDLWGVTVKSRREGLVAETRVWRAAKEGAGSGIMVRGKPVSSWLKQRGVAWMVAGMYRTGVGTEYLATVGMEGTTPLLYMESDRFGTRLLWSSDRPCLRLKAGHGQRASERMMCPNFPHDTGVTWMSRRDAKTSQSETGEGSAGAAHQGRRTGDD